MNTTTTSQESAMSYEIRTTDGRKWASSYPTRDAAADAIRTAYSWDAVVLSASYTVDGPRGAADGDTTTAVSAYETQEECDADETGAHAPQIVDQQG